MINSDLVDKHTPHIYCDVDKALRIKGKYSPIVGEVGHDDTPRRMKKITKAPESELPESQLPETQIPESQIALSQLRTSARKRRKTSKVLESQDLLSHS